MAGFLFYGSRGRGNGSATNRDEMMIRLTTILIILLAAADCCTAQAWYLGIGGGYGTSIGTSFMTTKIEKTTAEGVYGSYGAGVRIVGSIGGMVSESVGLEIGVNYLHGDTFEGGDNNVVEKYYGSGLIFAPVVFLRLPGDEIRPYGKIGAVLGFVKVSAEINDKPTRLQVVAEERGGHALGFTAGAGVVFRSGEVIQLFAEMVITTLTNTPSKFEIVSYELNGVDQLSTVTDRSFRLEESFPLPQANDVLLAPKEPFSSMGVNIGLRVAFF